MKILFIAAAILGFFGWLLFGSMMPNYSDGERTGDVYKFSKKGVFAKSWEGEMYLGGFTTNGNGGLQAEKFYFSLPGDSSNTEAIEKLQLCAKERRNCTIHYNQWFKEPWYLGSSYVVQGVDVGDRK
jgi:hypothetical protein